MDDSQGLHKKDVEPNWRMLADHLSVLVERGYYDWLKNGKNKRHSRARVSAEHFVDYAVMQLIELTKGQRRWIRRGAQG